MINLNFTVKNATQPLCAVCALSVRCLCVVCALSVRCLCAVCAPSVLRGADLKFAKRARAPALRHDAPRTYRGADSFPDSHVLACQISVTQASGLRSLRRRRAQGTPASGGACALAPGTSEG